MHPSKAYWDLVVHGFKGILGPPHPGTRAIRYIGLAWTDSYAATSTACSCMESRRAVRTTVQSALQCEPNFRKFKCSIPGAPLHFARRLRQQVRRGKVQSPEELAAEKIQAKFRQKAHLLIEVLGSKRRRGVAWFGCASDLSILNTVVIAFFRVLSGRFSIV